RGEFPLTSTLPRQTRRPYPHRRFSGWSLADARFNEPISRSRPTRPTGHRWHQCSEDNGVPVAATGSWLTHRRISKWNKWIQNLFSSRFRRLQGAFMGRFTISLFAMLLLASPTFAADEGAASFYPGRRPGELTAAHRSLPFGTRVRVTRLGTGRSVIVRIN